MAKPIIAIFDDFLPGADEVLGWFKAKQFQDVQSPIDGVIYPGICLDIQPAMRDFIKMRLAQIIGSPVFINAQFARLTTKSLREAPHKIHSDKIMGQYSAHIYLSKEWPEGAGTSLWIHRSQGEIHGENTDTKEIIKDQNDESKWIRGLTCQGSFNRAFIHDARLWHCAEPVGGWGNSAADGRLVLTTFFSEAAK